MPLLSSAFLNLAYVALVSASLARAPRRLRAFLVAASIAFITFAVLEQIWSMVLWNIGIGGSHAVHLFRDRRRFAAAKLTVVELGARNSFFADLSDVDFHVLWSSGSTVTASNETIVGEGTKPKTVSLVLGGVAEVFQRGQLVRGIRRGGLVGEMSFVSGVPADATVVARGDVVMHQWDHDQLAVLDQTNPKSFRSFSELIARDLAAKARLTALPLTKTPTETRTWPG